MNRVKLMLVIGLLVSGITGCQANQTAGGTFRDQQTEYWTVERVADGDTLTVAKDGQEERIRLCGIDAPEKAQPLGDASRTHLQKLLEQSQSGQVGVVPVERDQYGRLVAEVFVPVGGEAEVHINSQMVADSMAYVYDKYVDGCPNGSVIEKAGAQAEKGRQGVWSGNQVKPWDFRQQNKQ